MTTCRSPPKTPPTEFPPGLVDIRRIEVDEKFVVTIDARVGNIVYRGVRSTPLENPVFVLMKAMSVNGGGLHVARKDGVLYSTIDFEIHIKALTESHQRQIRGLKNQKALIENIFLDVGGPGFSREVDGDLMEQVLSMYREVLVDHGTLTRSHRLDEALAKRAAAILGWNYRA